MYIQHGMSLVLHHTHYLELHGYDKTVFMNRNKHKKLHYRLRREGTCNIPAKELKNISDAACNRNRKEENIKYQQKNKEKLAAYYHAYRNIHKEKNRKSSQEYRDTHKEEINKYTLSRKKEKAEYDKKYNLQVRKRKSLHSININGLQFFTGLIYNLNNNHITFINEIRKSGGR